MSSTLRSGPASAVADGARRPAVTLILIVACQLVIAIAVTLLNIALPRIQREMELSPAELSWIPNAYMLTFGGLLLLGGRAGDILGRRRMLVVGLGLFSAASLAGSVAQSPGWMMAALAGQGVGAALAEPASLALIASNFKEGASRDKALAAFATAAGLGLAIGLIVVGALTALSWRWAMFVNAPVGLVIMVLVPFFVKETKRYPGRFDAAGALTSTLAMGALVYGFGRAGSAGWTDRWVDISFAAAAVLIAAAVVVELRAERPVLALRLLADRGRAGAYFNTMVIGAVAASLLFCLTQFLENVRGLTPLQAGLRFLPMALTLFASASVAPRLLARFSAKWLVTVSMAVLSCGVLLFSRITVDTAYATGVLIPLLLIGAGQGLAVTALNSLILSRISHQDAGAASGLQQTMMRVGASLGLAVTVTVFAVAGRKEAATPGGRGPDGPSQIIAHGIASAFLWSAVIALCAVAVSVLAVRSPRPEYR